MYLTHCRTFSSIHHAKSCIRVFRTGILVTYMWDGPVLLFYCVPSYFFLSLLSQPDTWELTDRSVAIKPPPQTLNSLTLVPMVALVWPASWPGEKKSESK